MFGAMDFGISDHGQRASREQAAQIAVALFADTAKLLLSPLETLRRARPPNGRLGDRLASYLKAKEIGDD